MVNGPYRTDPGADGVFGDPPDTTDDTLNPEAIGLDVAGADLTLAILKAPMSGGATPDTRSWTALKANLSSVSFVGVDAFKATGSNISASINTAAGDLDTIPGNANDAMPINWATALNLDGGAFGEAGDQIGFDPTPGLPSSGDEVMIDQNGLVEGAAIRAAGTLQLEVADFFFAKTSISLTKRTVDVKLSPSETLMNASLLQIGVSIDSAFVGVKGPYRTDPGMDGVFGGSPGSTDDTLNTDAIGLDLANADLALAVVKAPMSTTMTPDTRSWTTLKATVGNADFVGVDALIASTSNLSLEINTASGDKDTMAGNGNEATPLDWGAVLDLDGDLDFGDGSGDLIVYDPSMAANDEIALDLSGQLIRASAVDPAFGAQGVTLGLDLDGNGTPEVSLAADIFFEQAIRTNGSKITKIAVFDVDIALGDPEIFGLRDNSSNNPSGFLVITEEGLAAQFEFDPPDFGVSGFMVSANLITVAINTSPTRIIEEFALPGQTPVTLDVPGGEYLRVAAEQVTVSVSIGDGGTTPDFMLTTDVSFEQMTLPGGTQKVIRVGIAKASAQVAGVTFANGTGGFIFYPQGVAGKLSVDVTASTSSDPDVPDPGAQAQAQARVVFNTTGLAPLDETIVVGTETINVKFEAGQGNFFDFVLLNASIEFPPFFKLSGDFKFGQSTTIIGAKVYGARDVELFIGEGFEDGELQEDAIGLMVTNGTVGAIHDGATGKFAVFAFGEAKLIGLEGLTISATVRVRINQFGVAISEIIELPDDPEDPGADPNIAVNLGAGKVQIFEAGYDINGNILDPPGVMISAADVLTIAGAVRFTRAPSGRVEVDIPVATVSINIPSGSGSEEAFSVSGAARFFIGGGQGFQLQDLRLTGFSILGVGATLPTQASALRPLTADLASPFNGQRVDVATLNEQGYIDVVFNDVNRNGVNEGLITEGTAEFVLLGASAANVQINGAAQKVTDANNDRTFRYSFTGQFDASVGSGIVEVEFLADRWADSRGTPNAGETERFRVYSTVDAPDPLPFATLNNPFNGAVVSAQSINARRYIDVTFNSPLGGEVTGIDGDEFRLIGLGATNLALTDGIDPRGAGFVGGTPLKLGSKGNTYRYFLRAEPGIDFADTFKNGEIQVLFDANKWMAGGVANTRATARFEVKAGVEDTAAATSNQGVGPISLMGPSIGLAKLGFADGNLVVTIGIGVQTAMFNFGGGGQNMAQPSMQQSNSKITAELTGVLGKFDVEVDIIALTQGDLSAFGASGKFSLEVASLKVEVPNAVLLTGTGLMVEYDPNYDPADHNGESQRIVTVNSASLSILPLDVTGSIEPFFDADTSTTLPGLVVRSDGFELGRATLAYGVTPPGTTGNLQNTSQSGGQVIKLGNILEFDDIRIGVENFKVVFGQDLDFDGNIFIASGGARFFPGRPVNATISDPADLRAQRRHQPGHRSPAGDARVRKRQGGGVPVQGRYLPHRAR